MPFPVQHNHPANTLVVVRYGSNGEQIAQLLRIGSRPGWLKVRKWRRNGRTWTGAASIEQRDFLRVATDADVKRFKPEGV